MSDVVLESWCVVTFSGALRDELMSWLFGSVTWHGLLGGIFGLMSKTRFGFDGST